MELFTLGIGNYTESDVQESARARPDGRSSTAVFASRPISTTPAPKIILGRRGAWTGADLRRHSPNIPRRRGAWLEIVRAFLRRARCRAESRRSLSRRLAGSRSRCRPGCRDDSCSRRLFSPPTTWALECRAPPSTSSGPRSPSGEPTHRRALWFWLIGSPGSASTSSIRRTSAAGREVGRGCRHAD